MDPKLFYPEDWADPGVMTSSKLDVELSSEWKIASVGEPISVRSS